MSLKPAVGDYILVSIPWHKRLRAWVYWFFGFRSAPEFPPKFGKISGLRNDSVGMLDEKGNLWVIDREYVEFV